VFKSFMNVMPELCHLISKFVLLLHLQVLINTVIRLHPHTLPFHHKHIISHFP